MEAGEALDLDAALRARGKRSRGHLQPPGHPPLPVAVVAGEGDGPTVWVNAGAHGDEPLGPAALGRLLPALSPPMVTGSIVATPILDVAAFRAARRGRPRVGGGSPGAAAFALAEILPRCDALVDLHGGGARLLRAAVAAYIEGNGGAGDSAGLARASGLPLLLALGGPWAEAGLLEAASRWGRAAVALALGGGGTAEEPMATNLALALQGALAGAGVLRAAPRLLPSYTVVRRLRLVRAGAGGLWRRAVEPEVPVAAGAPLGRILDPFGEAVMSPTAPGEGVVLAVRTSGIVARGALLAEIGGDREVEGGPRVLDGR